MQYNRIIFVGKSGTCREPMAVGIMKSLPIRRGVEVLARGLIVQFPEPMNQKAEAVLNEKHITTVGFTSSQLVREDITDHTLILTMESAQRRRVLTMFPDVDPGQVGVLAGFVGEELETVDPYGGALANYGLCYESLLRSIRKLVAILELTVDLPISYRIGEDPVGREEHE